MDSKVENVLIRGSAVGAFGASVGLVLATFRPGSSIPFYTASMGANYAIFGYTYFSFLELYQGQRVELPEAYKAYDTDVNRHMKHIASGASTGFLWSTIFAGPKKGILGALVFGTVGLAGSVANDYLERWRRKQGDIIREQREQDA